MPRILPVSPDQTDAKTAAAFKATEARLGMLPNLFTTLARAPAALNGYLQLAQALGQGRLSARQRELIAIAVAQENACAYCLSAHAAIGQSVVNRHTHRIISVVGTSPKEKMTLVELAQQIAAADPGCGA